MCLRLHPENCISRQTLERNYRYVKHMTRDEILKRYFGYDSFRTGQETIIDAVLAGRDALGIMPTGAGKSICYQVPALMLPGITLVISPLISLMKDQVQALNQAGIHAAFINSSLTAAQVSKALRLAAGGRYKIIYVAPERLETYEFLQFATGAQISMVTVDEAHCISQWGQDFRPSYLNIVDFVRRLPVRPVISAFTATATTQVREDIICVLGLQQPEVLVTGFDRKNLYFGVEKPRKKDDWVCQYIQSHKEESGIIYCATRKNVDTLYELLLAKGIPVARYHAGLENAVRQRSQEDFIYDKCPVMLATNAFGMGIDKSNVRYVLHYNMPQSLENYYQEAGRAGRDGEPSECILLYAARDVMINRYLIEHKEDNEIFDEEQRRAVRERDGQRLNAMQYYCMTTECLRRYILRYFGEQLAEDCGNCSGCRQEYEEADITDRAVKIIRCVQETGQRYGVNVIAGTLAGENRAKLREYGVSSYESYGSLSDMTEPDIRRMIDQLLLAQVLAVTSDRYALVKLTEKAAGVLRQGTPVIIKMAKTQDQPDRADKQKKQAANTRRSDILNTRGLELFEQLRALRSQIASEESLPPYIIFSDRTLTDLCIKVPFQKADMMRVNGVGEHKYEKYGQRFLDKILEFSGGVREKYYFGDMEEAADTAGTGGSSDKKPKEKRMAFYLTAKQAGQFPYEERYLAPKLAEELNSLRDQERTKKISGAEIYRLMQAKEYVHERKVEGKWQKIITPEGAQAGLFLDTRVSKAGNEYEDVYYNEQAQRMIVNGFVKGEE